VNQGTISRHWVQRNCDGENRLTWCMHNQLGLLWNVCSVFQQSVDHQMFPTEHGRDLRMLKKKQCLFEIQVFIFLKIYHSVCWSLVQQRLRNHQLFSESVPFKFNVYIFLNYFIVYGVLCYHFKSQLTCPRRMKGIMQ